MSKHYKESSVCLYSHRGNRNNESFLKLSGDIPQAEDDLCAAFPHNSPSWVAYMDKPELSCRVGLDNVGPKITFSTGKNTKIDTEQVCQHITSDSKDQDACIKRLDRGLLPGINGEKGEVTVYLDEDGNFSFREDGLFTDAREYNVVNLVSAVGSAQYTQRTPDMTALRMKATIEDNPIIVDIGMGVIGVAVIYTLANLAYLSIKSRIAKRNQHKKYLKPIPILRATSSTPKSVNMQDTKPIGPTVPKSDPYLAPKYYFPHPSKHTKNKQEVKD